MAEIAATRAPTAATAELQLHASELDERLKSSSSPFIVRGVAKDWPLVRSGIDEGGAGARAYLLRHARNRQFEVNVGQPGEGGRLFYDEQMGMNFRMGRASLPDIFAGIDANWNKPDAPVIYLSSLTIQDHFDGLHEANTLDLFGRETRDSIWIGTRSHIAAHNDIPNNLAVCAVGRRRYNLFPPEVFADLYLGPLENTPAGREEGMGCLSQPDFHTYPPFTQARDLRPVSALEFRDD